MREQRFISQGEVDVNEAGQRRVMTGRCRVKSRGEGPAEVWCLSNTRFCMNRVILTLSSSGYLQIL